MAVEIPRGFLVTQRKDEAGNYIPFLVKVREEDIIWKDHKDSTFARIMESFPDSANGNDKIVPLHFGYRTVKNGWFCEIAQDGLATLTKAIPFDNGFTINESNTILTCEQVKLPFLLINDDAFHIQLTKNSLCDEITLADLNVVKNATTTWQYNYGGKNKTFTGYDNFKLQVVSPLYKFHSDFSSRDNYKNSKLFILVRGYLPYMD